MLKQRTQQNMKNWDLIPMLQSAQEECAYLKVRDSAVELSPLE